VTSALATKTQILTTNRGELFSSRGRFNLYKNNLDECKYLIARQEVHTGPPDDQYFRLPGTGDGDSSSELLPESERSLQPCAGCCKRYTRSATVFSYREGHMFSRAART
jgi:hypothetical protein